MALAYKNGHSVADYRMHEVAHLIVKNCKNAYARAYAGGMLDISPYDYTEIHAQTLYMLTNISHWRGKLATDCRNKCKEWIAEYNAMMPR